MIIRFPDRNSVQELGDFRDWCMVYVQVRGDASIRIAGTSAELSQIGPGGNVQGVQFLAADGMRRLWWKGKMYGIGDADGAAADFQFLS